MTNYIDTSTNRTTTSSSRGSGCARTHTISRGRRGDGHTNTICNNRSGGGITSTTTTTAGTIATVVVDVVCGQISA